MADDSELLAVLRSIDRRLALLTGPQEREVRQRLTSEVLRTEARLKMFDAIDGDNGSQDLAKVAGVSERTAQQLVKDLQDLGFVSPAKSTTGRGFAVAKNEDAILKWHLHKSAQESDAAHPPATG